MKILLLGKNGQLGWELQRSLAPLGELIALSHDSHTICGDLTDLAGIQQTIATLTPDIIVNAAAYTAVDKAESEPEQADIINVQAPALLAQEAKKINAWLIHYSTDYVFDGSGHQAKLETDATNPQNVYGKTKLAGEQNIIASGCNHLIFRTSWVYAAKGHNFIRTMLGLAQERDELKVVDDQIGAPTGAELIADVTAQIIGNKLKSEQSGLYHLAADGQASWYDFAHFILTQAQDTDVALKVQPQDIQAIKTVDFPLPATRPLNSRLNTGKLKNTFNLNLPKWQTSAARTLTEILSSLN